MGVRNNVVDRGAAPRGCLKSVLIITIATLLPAGPLAAGTLLFDVRDGEGEPVANAAIWVSPSQAPVEVPEPDEVAIDQIDRQFVPHVTIVQTGAQIHFPNKDNIRHHVYSFSDAKRFELPLYKGTPAEPVLFDQPGIVTLGCNIHDWMMAHVVVVETPLFAVTDGEGTAAIADLPPGDYVVELWHPRLQADSDTIRREITLPGDEELEVALAIELRPNWRLRRGARRGGGYR